MTCILCWYYRYSRTVYTGEPLPNRGLPECVRRWHDSESDVLVQCAHCYAQQAAALLQNRLLDLMWREKLQVHAYACHNVTVKCIWQARVPAEQLHPHLHSRETRTCRSCRNGQQQRLGNIASAPLLLRNTGNALVPVSGRSLPSQTVLPVAVKLFVCHATHFLLSHLIEETKLDAMFALKSWATGFCEKELRGWQPKGLRGNKRDV